MQGIINMWKKLLCFLFKHKYPNDRKVPVLQISSGVIEGFCYALHFMPCERCGGWLKTKKITLTEAEKTAMEIIACDLDQDDLDNYFPKIPKDSLH
jgi:hypothetical protein